MTQVPRPFYPQVLTNLVLPGNEPVLVYAESIMLSSRSQRTFVARRKLIRQIHSRKLSSSMCLFRILPSHKLKRCRHSARDTADAGPRYHYNTTYLGFHKSCRRFFVRGDQSEFVYKLIPSPNWR